MQDYRAVKAGPRVDVSCWNLVGKSDLVTQSQLPPNICYKGWLSYYVQKEKYDAETV